MIGTKLDQYTIMEIIGSGRMGTVFKAENPDGQTLALRLVPSRILNTMQKRERFLQHALTASEIRSDAICPILEIGDDNDNLYVITPFIDGKTLDQYTDGKALSWKLATAVALQTGTALEVIHRAGAVHRRLTPANIWILDDQNPTIMISDPCIAPFSERLDKQEYRSSCPRVHFADTLTAQGSPAYLSPEQLRGNSLDCRSDIFSFGIILFKMLSGCHPFEGGCSFSQMAAIFDSEPPSLTSKKSDVPSGFESIVQKALAKTPEKRYQKISELLTDMRAVRRSAQTQTDRTGMPAGICQWLSSKIRPKRKS